MIPRRKPYFAPKFFKKILPFLLTQPTDQTTKLESELKKVLKLPNPLVVGQGRIAFAMILKALNLKKGSEVIIPGYTFSALIKTIKSAGLIPKPVDIDIKTFQMAPIRVKQAINKKTAVILATHLFGESCDIYMLKNIAKRHNLILIEDCAQSLGATINDHLIGTYGDIAFSSFDVSKPLQGIRGGLIFGTNTKLINSIRKQLNDLTFEKEFGFQEIFVGLIGFVLIQTFVWQIAMFIFSYKDLQNLFVKLYRSDVNKKHSIFIPQIFAFLLRINLTSLAKRLKKRRQIRSVYYSLLKNRTIFQKTQKNSLGSLYMLVARVNVDIYKLRRYLALRGIDIAIKNEIADNLIHKGGSNVDLVIDNAIAIPMYEDLNKKDIIYIANSINNFCKENEA